MNGIESLNVAVAGGILMHALGGGMLLHENVQPYQL
jgi:hypothetical protein